MTHLYTYPDALDDQQGRATVEAALARLSAELQLPHELKLKPGHVSRITVPDTTPDETWDAIRRVVADWPDLLPRPTD